MERLEQCLVSCFLLEGGNLGNFSLIRGLTKSLQLVYSTYIHICHMHACLRIVLQLKQN